MGEEREEGARKAEGQEKREPGKKTGSGIRREENRRGDIIQTHSTSASGHVEARKVPYTC